MRISSPTSIPFRTAISVKEFCATWGIGRTLFYRLVKEGQIRVLHLGRRTLVPSDQGEGWPRAMAS